MTAAYMTETGEKAAAYRLLAYAVREICAIPCPEIAKDMYGKPYFPTRPDIFFSISHTGTRCLSAVSDSPVGCDIELIRPVPQRLIRRVCTPEELSNFTFFELWTLKEAYFKLHGHLPYPFWEARFTPGPAGILTPTPGLHASLYPAPLCAAALVGASPLPERIVDIPLKNIF